MKRLVIIGRVTAPHGIKGEVRVQPLTDFPERYTRGLRVMTDENPSRSLVVETARSHKQYILVQFEGLADRNEVEALRGILLQIPEEETMPLPEGRYYIYQLIGLKVALVDGTEVGSLAEVLSPGPHDVYVIKKLDGKLAYIPAVKEFIKEINIDKGIMVIDPIPGMLDE